MIAIQRFLDRIRWDPGFGRGQFTIGYYDRVDCRIVNAPHNRPAQGGRSPICAGPW
jgi:uncharacterized protein (UPF0248 family)